MIGAREMRLKTDLGLSAVHGCRTILGGRNGCTTAYARSCACVSACTCLRRLFLQKLAAGTTTRAYVWVRLVQRALACARGPMACS
eukprot:6181111-Pleurochrysis_carterae.AAC.1